LAPVVRPLHDLSTNRTDRLGLGLRPTARHQPAQLSVPSAPGASRRLREHQVELQTFGATATYRAHATTALAGAAQGGAAQ